MNRQNPGRPNRQYPNGRKNSGQNGYAGNAGFSGRNPRVPQERQGQNDVPELENRQPESFLEKIHGWRLGISIEIEPIIRGLACLVLISFFALLQTTLFARFRPFGAVPDLMLSLVVAVSMIAREKWGAVSGLAAAFVIESLGGSTVTILSLLYMPVGYICGLLTVYYFRDGLAVRAMYTAVTAMARGFFTLLILVMSKPSVTLPDAIVYAVIPEFFATILFAFLPHLTVKYVFRLTEGKKTN
ncbi:MAG: hypothetical protein IJX14_12310 [Clostridia bacterium]|nr:hypothetical protein [Clostridia bacterium]